MAEDAGNLDITVKDNNVDKEAEDSNNENTKTKDFNNADTGVKNENTTEGPKKHKSANIPPALFIEDMNEYMTKAEYKTESVMKKLDEQYSKYKFMEANLTKKKERSKSQIPDLERSLAAIDMLKKNADEGKEVICDFRVSDEVYSQAKIPCTKTVCLWLGANVMLEYPLDEATVLLNKNIETAKQNIAVIDTDLNFLRDQRTILEVNMSRVYNWDVSRRVADKSVDKEIPKK